MESNPGRCGETLYPKQTPLSKITIAPLLNVRDGASAINFYKAAFGATVIFSTSADMKGSRTIVAINKDPKPPSSK